MVDCFMIGCLCVVFVVAVAGMVCLDVCIIIGLLKLIKIIIQGGDMNEQAEKTNHDEE